jgi:4-hydroxy-L-threonine phosphate dehydrogenase PdxA
MAHGTPMDIAGKGIASPAALIAAFGVLTGHPT